MHQDIVNCLNTNGWVLTPSRRLASYLQQSYAAQVKTAVWQKPQILAIADWFKSKWEQFEIQGLTEVQLLTPMQSVFKMESLIKLSEVGKNLYRKHETAKLVLQAWQMCHQYGLTRDDIVAENLDQSSFLTWIDQYQSWLNENQYIDDTLIYETLLPILTQEPPQQILLYGFEEILPQLQHMIKRLQAVGWTISQLQYPGVKAQSQHYYSYSSFEKECHHAAQWAKKQSQTHTKVAVICQKLTDHRAIVEKIFKDTFHPLSVVQPVATEIMPFNLSAAIPLDHYPLIAQALCLLRIGLWQFKLNDYIQMLKTASTRGYNEEVNLRMQHAFELRLEKDVNWNLKQANNMLLKTPYQPPIWREIMLAQATLLQTKPVNRYKKATALFHQILNLWGWPGERPLSSVEYQLVKRWQQLLDELSSMHVVDSDVDYMKAYSTLAKMAANTAFQAENKSARVQVLGLLEAVGQPFECAWIMGMDNESWPPIFKPNPFIPMHLQRQYDLPHSSPKRELRYAQLLGQQLNRCAEHIVYSFSLDQSERELDWSPLLDAQVVSLSEQPKDKIARIEEAHFNVIALESLQDDLAPAVLPTEGVRGNSQLLETQAKCPFKAFAEYRLYAKSYEEEALWLSRATAGTILHEILERFWRDTQSQQHLRLIGDLAAFAKLDQLIEDAFKKYISWQVPVLYLNVEKQRLTMLLQSFIQLEQSRPAFKVEYLEEKRRFVLDEIPFEIRMDRIDLDEAGNRILIDYKSGQVSLNDLWSERLQAVQLPLYYFQLPADKPKAVVFAGLYTPVSYIGLGDTDFGIEGLKPLTSIRNQPYTSMNDLTQHWQRQISVLVSEFKTGVARVDPIDGAKTCEVCKLSPFCRVHEQAVNHE